MEQLDNKRIGFKAVINNHPCEVYVTKIHEDNFGLALAMDHGHPYGKVYYQNIAGGYGSPVDAETAIQDLISNLKGGIDLSEGWKPISSRPLAFVRLTAVNEEKDDWRDRESRQILKDISNLVD
jgi:hypothetical protein